jgi:outer membrane murein-binding lipoprotein Lpp
MNSQQLEAEAAEARDEIAGKIETLEAERDELQARATAAMRELGLEPGTLAEADGLAASGRIEELETELRLSKEETASVAKISSQWQSKASDYGSGLEVLKSRFDVEVGRSLALGKQLDTADKALSEAQNRIEELETELRLSKGETQEMARIAERWQTRATDLNRQLDAACAKRRTQGETIGQRDRTLHELRCKLDVEMGGNRVLRRQLDESTDLVIKVEDERGAAIHQRDDAEAKKLTWMRLHDEAKREVLSLRIRIAVAERAGKVEELEQQIKALNGELNIANQRAARAETQCQLRDAAVPERDALRCVLTNLEGRTRYVMLSCENMIRIIEGLEPKGETDGDDTGM